MLALLRHDFRARAGRWPDGVWSAPGRVNVVGEHTDYNDGFALPMAIDRHVWAAVATRDDGRLRCWSRQVDGPVDLAPADVAPGQVDGWAAYPAGVVWALREAGVEVGGLDIVVDASVPVGGGLSSSAALECAVALAVCDLAGADLDRTAIALAAQRAEHEVAGVPCGVMDQLASMHGEAGHVLLLDARSRAVEPVPFDLPAAGLTLVVADTRVAHTLGAGAYAERRRTCEEAAGRLGVTALRDVTPADVEAAAAVLGEVAHRRARHVTTEDDRVLAAVARLHAGDPAGIGPLLDESHTSLRDDYEVSCAELDVAVGAARAAGALGARMTGGGFGGAAIALVPVDAAGAVSRAVADAFTERGWATPDTFEVAPAAGARRLG